ALVTEPLRRQVCQQSEAHGEPWASVVSWKSPRASGAALWVWVANSVQDAIPGEVAEQDVAPAAATRAPGGIADAARVGIAEPALLRAPGGIAAAEWDSDGSPHWGAAESW